MNLTVIVENHSQRPVNSIEADVIDPTCDYDCDSLTVTDICLGALIVRESQIQSLSIIVRINMRGKT